MKEKVVFITGAKGGLGSFITRRFLETGVTVVGASRSISSKTFQDPISQRWLSISPQRPR